MNTHYIDTGRLEMICGPMFSGKSEELIRRLKRTLLAKIPTVIFTPKIDDRYEEGHICSHDGKKLKAIPISNIEEVYDYLTEDVLVIGFDEVQFIEGDPVSVIKQLVSEGKRVVCAGLDMDFKADPFLPMPTLFAIADEVTKLTAVCMCCGRPANFSQRLVEGTPVSKDAPLIQLGASESYEARCRKCYE